MSAIQAKEQPLGNSSFPAQRASLGTSAAAKLIELGRALAGAELSASFPRICYQCGVPGSSNNSTAQCPKVFCSEQCEQEFVRAALASLTLEDCIRMQQRLETLLVGAEASAFSGGRRF
jgi:hypothetical protein